MEKYFAGAYSQSVMKQVTPVWSNFLFSISVEESEFGAWDGSLNQIKKFVERVSDKNTANIT